jgi:hypothetical protein
MMLEPRISELSTCFPEISGTQFDALVEDIRKNGQIEAITLNDAGEIIDGRNRFNACKKLGVEPVFERFQGGYDDQLRLVVSKNLLRRHLSESQRAMLGARLLGNSPTRDRYADVAQTLNIGTKSIRTARQVMSSGKANVVNLVERGAVSVNRAADHIRGKIAAEELETGHRGGRGGSSQRQHTIRSSQRVTRVYRALDALSEVLSDLGRTIDEWPGDPARNRQLDDAARFLMSLSNGVKEAPGAIVSA